MKMEFAACLFIILSSLLIQHGVSGSKVSVQLQLSDMSYTLYMYITDSDKLSNPLCARISVPASQFNFSITRIEMILYSRERVV